MVSILNGKASKQVYFILIFLLIASFKVRKAFNPVPNPTSKYG